MIRPPTFEHAARICSKTVTWLCQFCRNSGAPSRPISPTYRTWGSNWSKIGSSLNRSCAIWGCKPSAVAIWSPLPASALVPFHAFGVVVTESTIIPDFRQSSATCAGSGYKSRWQWKSIKMGNQLIPGSFQSHQGLARPFAGTASRRRASRMLGQCRSMNRILQTAPGPQP